MKDMLIGGRWIAARDQRSHAGAEEQQPGEKEWRLDHRYVVGHDRRAAGEWRDYAIDLLPDQAVFSIYRRASEVPMFRVVKQPELARKQGAFSVVAAGGLIMKRGQDLARVLRVLDKGLSLVTA